MTTNESAAPFRVRLRAIVQETEQINLFEFRPLRGQTLPTFAAGAHIDLHLDNGLIRSYSLVNPQGEHDRYVIAVKNETNGRGGSRSVHKDLRVGTDVTIGPPRNNFPLREDAAHSVFIAGGIGITPLFCMVQRLEHLGRPWELHYAAASRDHAAFLPRLEVLRPRTHLYFRQEGGELDIGGLAARLREDADIYCCGPLRMMADFEGATASRPPERVHAEYFTARDAPATDGGFEVLLQKSGQRLIVGAGETILDALIRSGVDAPYSCMEGVCGSCETRVLEGIPDHRDLILSKQEREANDKMLICCSGSRSARLVLDL
jgi:ferredoxin-NADP reductase